MSHIDHKPKKAKRASVETLSCCKCSTSFTRLAKAVRADRKRGRSQFYCSTICRDKVFQEKRLPASLKCKQCNTEFVPKSGAQQFCSQSCAAIHNNRSRDLDDYKQRHFSLRTYIEFEPQEPKKPKDSKLSHGSSLRICGPVKRLDLTCEGCGKSVVRTASQMKKSKHGKPYCSKSCRMSHYNAHILKRSSSQRSKAEDFLFDLLREAYPTLEISPNDRSLVGNGLEVDLYIPSAKLAIELNGPVHYLPIYGEERLNKVQFKDAQKHAELHAKGIRLLVLDISQLKTKKRTEAFLRIQFDQSIRPLLMEAQIGVSPIIASKETVTDSSP